MKPNHLIVLTLSIPFASTAIAQQIAEVATEKSESSIA